MSHTAMPALGQRNSTNSLPVVIASDQGSLDVNIKTVAFSSSKSTLNSTPNAATGQTYQLAAGATWSGTIEQVGNNTLLSVLVNSTTDLIITLDQYAQVNGQYVQTNETRRQVNVTKTTSNTDLVTFELTDDYYKLTCVVASGIQDTISLLSTLTNKPTSPNVLDVNYGTIDLSTSQSVFSLDVAGLNTVYIQLNTVGARDGSGTVSPYVGRLSFTGTILGSNNTIQTYTPVVCYRKKTGYKASSFAGIIEIPVGTDGSIYCVDVAGISVLKISKALFSEFFSISGSINAIGTKEKPIDYGILRDGESETPLSNLSRALTSISTLAVDATRSTHGGIDSSGQNSQLPYDSQALETSFTTTNQTVTHTINSWAHSMNGGKHGVDNQRISLFILPTGNVEVTLSFYMDSTLTAKIKSDIVVNFQGGTPNTYMFESAGPRYVLKIKNTATGSNTVKYRTVHQSASLLPAELTSSGNLKTAIQESLPAGNNVIGSVKIDGVVSVSGAGTAMTNYAQETGGTLTTIATNTQAINSGVTTAVTNTGQAVTSLGTLTTQSATANTTLQAISSASTSLNSKIPTGLQVVSNGLQVRPTYNSTTYAGTNTSVAQTYAGYTTGTVINTTQVSDTLAVDGADQTLNYTIPVGGATGVVALAYWQYDATLGAPVVDKQLIALTPNTTTTGAVKLNKRTKYVTVGIYTLSGTSSYTGTPNINATCTPLVAASGTQLPNINQYGRLNVADGSENGTMFANLYFNGGWSTGMTETVAGGNKVHIFEPGGTYAISSISVSVIQNNYNGTASDGYLTLAPEVGVNKVNQVRGLTVTNAAAISHVFASPDGAYLYAVSTTENKLYCYKNDDNGLIGSSLTLVSANTITLSGVKHGAVSVCGRFLYLANGTTSVVTYDRNITNGTLIQSTNTFTPAAQVLDAVTIGPCGNFLAATSSTNGYVYVYNKSTTGVLTLSTTYNLGGAVSDVMFTPDSTNLIMAATGPGNVNTGVRDTVTNSWGSGPNFALAGAKKIAMTPDGLTIFVLGSSTITYFRRNIGYDVAPGQISFTGISGTYVDMTCSPDGAYLYLFTSGSSCNMEVYPISTNNGHLFKKNWTYKLGKTVSKVTLIGNGNYMYFGVTDSGSAGIGAINFDNSASNLATLIASIRGFDNGYGTAVHAKLYDRVFSRPIVFKPSTTFLQLLGKIANPVIVQMSLEYYRIN